MFNIHTELPDGASSKGYDRETFKDAMKCYTSVISQLQPDFGGVVVLVEDGVEIERFDSFVGAH